VRGLYSTDASNYRVVPDLVIVPADVDDLVAAVQITSRAGAPIVLRGAGTSMAGNAIGGVVIDVSRHLNSVLDIDPVRRTAVVEPGVVLTDLTGAAAAYGLTFGADPSSGSRATLGGMDSGCCALAGSFGFERGHYEVSRAAGERVLLPAVRAEPTRRSSSPTASAAAPRLARRQIGRRCTWPRCLPQRCHMGEVASSQGTRSERTARRDSTPSIDLAPRPF